MTDKKERRSWLDHPGKVALVAAVVGSIIVVVGQLFGTIFPIWFGPDLSDYNLICEPVYNKIPLQDTSDPNVSIEGGYKTFISTISAVNLHQIRKYTRQISLIATYPAGFDVIISDPIVSVDKPTKLRIKVNLTHLKLSESNYVKSNKYPIVIQGIGADGKARNCTIIMDNSNNNIRYINYLSRYITILN